MTCFQEPSVVQGSGLGPRVSRMVGHGGSFLEPLDWNTPAGSLLKVPMC